jgi:hypothetical protein
MTISNANLYVVIARFCSYFRVWQEGAVMDFEFLWVNIMAGPSKKMCDCDEEVLYELLQEN